ncbi:hypothetical protein [Streptomyces sp. NPDC051636]|uniref:hypothetical protein n=1 Tax=Streptomyces sp. NPDC051636 TaxID=3365663 RepID=UPI0037A0D335
MRKQLDAIHYERIILGRTRGRPVVISGYGVRRTSTPAHALPPTDAGALAPLDGRHVGTGSLSELLARELRARGRQVDVEHLHVPCVLKAADTSTGASA